MHYINTNTPRVCLSVKIAFSECTFVILIMWKFVWLFNLIWNEWIEIATWLMLGLYNELVYALLSSSSWWWWSLPSLCNLFYRAQQKKRILNAYNLILPPEIMISLVENRGTQKFSMNRLKRLKLITTPNSAYVDGKFIVKLHFLTVLIVFVPILTSPEPFEEISKFTLLDNDLIVFVTKLHILLRYPLRCKTYDFFSVN